MKKGHVGANGRSPLQIIVNTRFAKRYMWDILIPLNPLLWEGT